MRSLRIPLLILPLLATTLVRAKGGADVAVGDLRDVVAVVRRVFVGGGAGEHLGRSKK